MKDPALVIVNGLLKSADELGLNATERYGKDAHYQATLWKTADTAVAALGIEQVETGDAGFPLFRLRGVEDSDEGAPAGD
ncbi:MAG TPA: hypothetical protein VFV09_03145 [Actinomycetota bacterium]|jgi:hypothetical protein|nr:hypothetical protein [Actinomycetota bacterium]